MTQDQIKAKVKEEQHIMENLFQIMTSSDYDELVWQQYSEAGVRKSMLESKLIH